MSNGFIKDINILKEQVSETDFLSIDKSIEALSEKITLNKGSHIIGIVGAFGVGKSTLIEKVKDVRKDKDGEFWIHFDAWQFPERKELWDGLILETARQLGKLEIAKRSLDGEKHEDKKLAIDTAIKSAGLFAGIKTFGISALFQPAVALVGDTFKYFLMETPARRVYEMQEVFLDLLKKIKSENIIFVLEDIDRSGQDGLFFLETFKQFLLKNKLEKNVIVFVPISNKSYYSGNLDTYLKCLDFVEPYTKTKTDLSDFVSGFYEYEEPEYEAFLKEFLGYLYNFYPDMTLRKIKLILRQANANYLEFKRLGLNPNSLICIAIQASRYLDKNKDDSSVSLFEHWKTTNKIGGNDIVSRLIFITDKSSRSYSNETLIKQDGTLGRTSQINIVSKNNYSTPKYVDDIFNENKGYYLSDFYFRDL